MIVIAYKNHRATYGCHTLILDLCATFGKTSHDSGSRWFYDSTFYTREKLTETLKYMHANPVNRGLVDIQAALEPGKWSSYLYLLKRRAGNDSIDYPW